MVEKIEVYKTKTGELFEKKEDAILKEKLTMFSELLSASKADVYIDDSYLFRNLNLLYDYFVANIEMLHKEIGKIEASGVDIDFTK